MPGRVDDPRPEFPNVRDTPLEWIWYESDAFNRFRGTDWMPEPCRSCPLGRQEEDFGGCRCQALALPGDAAATDPVCQFSPHHTTVVAARDLPQTDEFTYRTTRVPGGMATALSVVVLGLLAYERVKGPLLTGRGAPASRDATSTSSRTP